MNEITLAPLPFADDALAPDISAKTVSFHYGKHHAGYVKTLNALIAGTDYAGMRLEEIIRRAGEKGDQALFNNAGQVWNHDFYWRSLAPSGQTGEPSAALLAAIVKSFGSMEKCVAALEDAAVKHFGSGWAWLVAEPGGKLEVKSTPNASTPAANPLEKPLLVIDVWEHAYYLDWQNARAAYVKAIAERHLNWAEASRRFG